MPLAAAIGNWGIMGDVKRVLYLELKCLPHRGYTMSTVLVTAPHADSSYRPVHRVEAQCSGLKTRLSVVSFVSGHETTRRMKGSQGS